MSFQITKSDFVTAYAKVKYEEEQKKTILKQKDDNATFAIKHLKNEQKRLIKQSIDAITDLAKVESKVYENKKEEEGKAEERERKCKNTWEMVKLFHITVAVSTAVV